MRGILMTVCFLLLFSCGRSKEDVIEIIDLTESLKNSRIMNLSEIASDVEYIALETTEECYVRSFDKVEFSNDHIFILDRRLKRVNVFDKRGKHIRAIDKKGRGPGEYINVIDIDIDPRDTAIFLFDTEGDKVLKYSFGGEFIREWKVSDSYASAFSLLEDNSFIFLTPYPNNAFNDGYSMSVFDSTFKLVKKFIRKDVVSKETAFSMGTHGMYSFEKFCDTMTYWEYVYKITNNIDFVPRYKITYPNPMPIDGVISENSRYNSLIDFIESDDFMFFGGNYKDDPFRTIYSKKTKEISTISLKSRDSMNYGFVNDIDGGFTFYPEGITSEGKLYCVFSLYELNQFLADSSIDKKEVFSENKREELIDLISKSKLEDNKCLMLVNLK